MMGREKRRRRLGNPVFKMADGLMVEHREISSFAFSLPISPCAPFIGTHLSLRSPCALYEDDWGRVSNGRKQTIQLNC